MVPDPVETGWEEDEEYKKDDSPIYITNNARLYVTKGLTYLLEAIVKVRSKYPNTNFRVYGDGPLREELLAYAEQLGLDGKQIFVGVYTSRDELNQIMAQTDIFAMSSILEGLPVALLEAMSYGRAVVVTPAGGIPEAIHDGENGLLCRMRDPEDLAEKIITLIENPALRHSLGRAARNSYLQGPYNPISVCKQYISIYENVLSGGK